MDPMFLRNDLDILVHHSDEALIDLLINKFSDFFVKTHSLVLSCSYFLNRSSIEFDRAPLILSEFRHLPRVVETHLPTLLHELILLHGTESWPKLLLLWFVLFDNLTENLLLGVLKQWFQKITHGIEELILR